jgi:glucosamine--fructose-6-phosphate aminotransferase (isomerizing)
MCGIVGYIGSTNAVDVLVPALKRLAYRGYDSSGVATINGHGLEVCKAIGKISNLEAQFSRVGSPSGTLGIAHTRWATHGRPCEANAHPHIDCQSRLAVVHNGIIENHQQLRASLVAKGHQFRSQTDTEVIAHLVESHHGADLVESISRAVSELRGSFAIACISEDRPDMLVAVRGGGSPLVIGCGDHETFLASDIPALLGRTRDVVVLEEGDMAILTRGTVSIHRLDGQAVHRPSSPIAMSQEAVERNGYPHFMLKEIFEQPDAVQNTLAERIDGASPRVELDGLGLDNRELASLSRVSFMACGTSWHASLLGAISKIVGRSLAREADGVLYTRGGLEIGVAATKTFTTQIAAVTLLALKIAVARGAVDTHFVSDIIAGLLSVPSLMKKVLEQNDAIRKIAEQFADRRDFLYLGRGLHYPMALEGALKLKEISYVHAEGYPAGEMKHGPIALIESGTPVVALATCGPTLSSMASNIQEVKARDGVVVAIVTEHDQTTRGVADIQIPIPRAPYWLQPFLVAIPLQLLAYHIATLRGADVDQPRNLAKSVTVE